MNTNLTSLLLITFISSLIERVFSERVAVFPGKQFCFHEDLKANVNFGIQFQTDEHFATLIVINFFLFISLHLF